MQLLDKIDCFFEMLQRCCCEGEWKKCYIPNVLLRKSINDRFNQKIIESSKRLEDNYDIPSGSDVPVNKTLVDIYKKIRIKSLLKKNFCYIKNENGYMYLSNKQLQEKLKEIALED